MLKEYMTISEVRGPLMFVEKVDAVHYDELVEVELTSGEVRRGKVLEAHAGRALVQLFEGTTGIDIQGTKVRFLGRVIEPLVETRRDPKTRKEIMAPKPDACLFEIS